ncbi:Glyoxylase, beta-lactamase superfamily II [Thermosyntropha lipolytica DSM 11003]|uniref:Glyoxylase, beta-lactamase superfamily II n=1 Tax=Thermosyntropha lipolytica DSM 11003 TaxID=1123382 RepID=A0A1M5PIS0_9FIRM|nr:MBL fold metallo-hydrolase [Thermosyntropha lipolytica]SHH01143.1 Glyoxylase, beta-lactamase superfamily II [Thermosyntropha lipolytica DSM 11003]
MQISPYVKVIGNKLYNFYLVGSRELLLAECGTLAGALYFIEEWEKLSSQPEIKYILVMHSHFDHVGGLPLLKYYFPEAKVLASQEAAEILGRENVVQGIKATNEKVLDIYREKGLLTDSSRISALKQYDFKIDKVLQDGEILEVDGLQVEIITSPGHSPCSLSAYIPEDKVMLVSDALGYKTPEGLMSPVFFHDYDLYLQTINRLAGYATDIIGVGHGEIIKGREDVEKFYQKAFKAAEDAFTFIAAKLAEGVEEDVIAGKLYDKYMQGALALYPREVMVSSMYALIKRVKTKSSNRNSF